jgi:hypothetical protein
LAKRARPLEYAPISARLLWTAVLLAVFVIAYVLAGVVGLAPLPRSVRALAHDSERHSGYALVSGWYLGLPFTANGNGIPPYVFSGQLGVDTSRLPSGVVVHVAPTLADLRAYRVVAVIDTATGDGSKWSPYVIHTVASAGVFLGTALVAGILLVALLFWVAGPVAMAMQSRTSMREARRATG